MIARAIEIKIIMTPWKIINKMKQIIFCKMISKKNYKII
jgi:hypothetical protein